MKLYKPLVKKISQVFDKGVIDLYYPSAYNKLKKKRFYFSDNNTGIVRFMTKEEAKIWLKQYQERKTK